MSKEKSPEIKDRAHKLYSKLFGARTRDDSIRYIEEALDDLQRATKTQTKREFTHLVVAEGTG